MYNSITDAIGIDRFRNLVFFVSYRLNLYSFSNQVFCENTCKINRISGCSVFLLNQKQHLVTCTSFFKRITIKQKASHDEIGTSAKNFTSSIPAPLMGVLSLWIFYKTRKSNLE